MISVVIPNYNYEKFLKDRINSIINQSISVSEIIFLDDASSDCSVQLARSILYKCGIPYKIILNKINSGSVFKQWEKGIKECKYNYIWIAEADDSCHRDFIKSVLPGLADNIGVGISYCNSEVIDDKNRIFAPGFYSEIYSKIDPEKWNHSYVNNGNIEIMTALSIKNTIPNVSGLLFRKQAILNILPLDFTYSFSGDWITYIRILENWDISYTSLRLNYHRQHKNRTTNRFDNTVTFYNEALNIISYCNSILNISEEISIKALENLLYQASINSTLDSNILSLLSNHFPVEMINEQLSLFFNRLSKQNRNYSDSLILRISNISLPKILNKLWKRRI